VWLSNAILHLDNNRMLAHLEHTHKHKSQTVYLNIHLDKHRFHNTG
jgi:hypothetical protein